MRERGGKRKKQRRRRLILGLIVSFSVCLGALGQQANRNAPDQKGDKSNGKEMPERAIELLVTPVAWNSFSGSYQSTDNYKQGDSPFFELVMKNQMPQATDIDMSVSNHLFQWRPRLVKDGKRVPYRNGTDEKLDKVDHEVHPFHGSRVVYRLEPAEPKRVGFLQLNDWYDLPLAPGRYELTFWFRFWGKEKPAKSNTAVFEVK
ncbi:MAG TPA: hypothetical protein VE961_19600 [Pyrinomonadaceae bacterium]|nr:hypothetical protein [Pyrinomonadaceae bacterium]